MENKKIRIFTGPRGSGKTRAAKEAAKGLETLFINGINPKPYKHWSFFRELTSKHQLVIIDSVPSIEALEDILVVLKGNRILVHQLKRYAHYVTLPNVIITCDFSSKDHAMPFTLLDNTSRRVQYLEIVEFENKEQIN